MDRNPAVLVRAREAAEKRRTFAQRLNPSSRFSGTSLSRLSGLRRASVSLITLRQGEESFAYHAHLAGEEWLYVVQGRGVADVDGRPRELGPGAFLGFPVPSVPHILRNPFPEDLVYLSGGENRDLDVLDYPAIGKRFVLLPQGERTAFHELGPAQFPFGPVDDEG